MDGGVGYGAVLLKDGEVVTELSGGVERDIKSRQVAGELVAVMRLLTYCADHSIDAVEIFYDYTGIEMWATGRWKTNTPLTQRYVAFVKRSPVNITWQKVKSHSGDTWNDRADELARQGAGEAETQHINSPVDQTLLAAIAEAFAVHLSDNGIAAEFDRVLNNQYARVKIFKGNKRVGFFDLYNTKNRPLDPYLHAFKDDALKRDVSTRWEAYKKTIATDKNA
jgi:ribonuclease HI